MDNISILTDPWLKEVIPWIEEVRQTGETFLKSEPKYDVDSPDRSNVSISASAGNRFTEAANDLKSRCERAGIEEIARWQKVRRKPK